MSMLVSWRLDNQTVPQLLLDYTTPSQSYAYGVDNIMILWRKKGAITYPQTLDTTNLRPTTLDMTHPRHD